jgi:hypothetical protein
MASFFSIQHHLVLVGGGHSHVDGLRVWAREPVPRVRVSVVTDTPRAVYSGMVPGLVAGQYRLEDCEFDVERLPEGQERRASSTSSATGSSACS